MTHPAIEQFVLGPVMGEHLRNSGNTLFAGRSAGGVKLPPYAPALPTVSSNAGKMPKYGESE
jgi:hypothetical protein